MSDFLPQTRAIAPPGVWSLPDPDAAASSSNGIELIIFQLPGQHVSPPTWCWTFR